MCGWSLLGLHIPAAQGAHNSLVLRRSCVSAKGLECLTTKPMQVARELRKIDSYVQGSCLMGGGSEGAGVGPRAECKRLHVST